MTWADLTAVLLEEKICVYFEVRVDIIYCLTDVSFKRVKSQNDDTNPV